MKLSGISGSFILFAAVIVLSCSKEFDPKQQPFPLIRTLPVINNDATGVQLNGELIKIGTDPVIDYGFVWAQKDSPIPGPDTFLISLGTDLEKGFSVRLSHKLITLKEYRVKAFVSSNHNTVYGEAVPFTSKMTSPTLITQFSTSEVLDADTLTIFGENFSESYGFVSIGGHQAEIESFGLRSVTVIVPAIPQAGVAGVLVTSAVGISNSVPITILNPSISSFSPTHGSHGQEITLYGRFSNNRFWNKVFFYGGEAMIMISSGSKLTVEVPYGISGNVTITINVNGKTFTTTDEFTVE